MHKFSPQNFQRLESPERYELLQPEHTLRSVGLQEGMTFVDVGAGTGFFSRAAAAIVGERGRVYALDTSEEMLNVFRSYGTPSNTILLQSAELSFPLESNIADITLLAFVAHEVSDLKKFLEESMRVTKSGGRIVVFEWKKQADGQNPPESERLSDSELETALLPRIILEKGSLNPFHYYCIIPVE